MEKQLRSNIWRLFVLSTITGGLFGFVLLEGWRPINNSQIRVIGNKSITKNTILNSVNTRLSQPILAQRPREIATILTKELPIREALIRRNLLPLFIEIEIQEIDQIAFASRRSESGQEKGILDIEGNWIPIKVAQKGTLPKKNIFVEGWSLKNRHQISKVLTLRNQLGSPLKKIIINPNGELNLQTKDFDLILLGRITSDLDQRLRTFIHLNRSLPSSFRNKTGSIIDLRDPLKPEVQVPPGKG